MLKATHINKSYQQLSVLKDVSLEVQKSEIVSIVGASGAGKSTLLHIISTLDNPTSGSVWIDGIEVLRLRGKSLAQFRNQKLGFVFQFHNLLPEFSAQENICMPAWLGGMARKEAEKKSEELMQYLGIWERRTHLPSEMSGGEQQRTAIARALINSPAIVFADEPSGNLDAENAKELHQLFLKLRQDKEQTFVVVTHNAELAQLSDRVLEIKQGMLNYDK
ncbi:MAG: ABC transporter ATP-binding protein [Cytophagales bacterium]|nr:MAG: ABC transporter ATP-binding protein [Cytophagales bacterium]